MYHEGENRVGKIHSLYITHDLNVRVTCIGFLRFKFLRPHFLQMEVFFIEFFSSAFSARSNRIQSDLTIRTRKPSRDDNIEEK